MKILFTSRCIFDCKYCINRASNDVERTSFTPDEICRLVIEFYRRNYIEAVLKFRCLEEPGLHDAPDLRRCCGRRNISFKGYIHVKAIPEPPRI